MDLTRRASFASHRLLGWIFWDQRAKDNLAALGVPDLIATEGEIKNHRFTGKVKGTPCYREGKVKRLQEWLGGSGQTLVRAINGEVVDLINRAEISSNGGGNISGGEKNVVKKRPLFFSFATRRVCRCAL